MKSYYEPVALLVAGLVWLGLAGCAADTHKDEIDGKLSVSFTDVTAEAGLGSFRHETGAFGDKWMPEWMGGGGGFFDFDGDGWPDVLLVAGGAFPGRSADTGPALRLYRNNRDGTFTDHTQEVGLGDLQTYAFGITVADYDNDGDPDIYVTTLFENMLLRNDNGVFTEVGQEAGVAGDSTWSSSAIFLDADLDGHVDLFVGNYVDWSPVTDLHCSLDGTTKAYCTPELYDGVPSRFYRNRGDGTFEDRTDVAGFLPTPGKTLGVAELDFNRDGWPDLVIANDMERDLLYRNNGDGTFTEQGMLSGIALDEHGAARAGMGIDAGDVANDGHDMIFVGNFADETIGVYRYIGDELFEDRAAASRIGSPSLMTLTFGLFLFDVDHDGDLDLFAANGHMQDDIENVQEGVSYRQAPQLYLYQGDGTFEEISDQVGGVFSQPIVARGAAYADFDRDGDLDILVTENGGRAHLWRNDTDGGAFLQVQLQGSTGNRDALGARVVAVLEDRRIERRIRTGSSYLSQSETVAHFGLGHSDRIDSLYVYWPGGNTSRYGEIDANQKLYLVEGEPL